MIHREKLIEQLSTKDAWDMVIIGGGASGLGIAVDAASRGYSTLLLEQYDFAKGTSSKSTKLIHGGVRYLAQGDIKLVYEALAERGYLSRNARHLFRKQEFIIPNYTWWGGYYYVIGLKFYDLLSKKFSLGSSKRISKKRVIADLPTLKTKGLTSGVSYLDGQFDDARLAINLAQTAVENGGCILNYFKVKALSKNTDRTISGVVAEDTENGNTYQIKAKVVINAAGIFTDKVLKMKDPEHKKTVVPSQGVHLVLDKSFLQGEKAIMIPRTSDGRVLFIIPWHDKVIAGTTDTLIKKPKIEPIAMDSEVDFILETINQFLTRQASRSDVLSVFSGLRPLAKPKGDKLKTKEVSRSHKIIRDENLISIVGGKWTTYRKMAEDVVDVLIANYGFEKVGSKTKTLSIHGNLDQNADVDLSHLSVYGSDLNAYIHFESEFAEYSELLHPDYPYKKGQVVWGVRYEMARTVEDILARRIRLLFLDARAAMRCAPAVAKLIANELEYSEDWIQGQIEQFNELAKKYILN